MSDEWPRALPAFETSDGDLHRSQSQAEDRQRNIENAKRATALLQAGASLGAALREVGFLSSDWLPELNEVFATTKLVIEHWQCRTQPGYQPHSIDRDGRVFVHGNAGSWSGSYGSVCWPKEVAEYWTDTKRRAARAKERGDG